MVDLLAVLPFRTRGFNRQWLQGVFAGLRTSCLLLNHPRTEVLIAPRASGLSICQDGVEVPLEAKSYVYLPASCERQHTALARIRPGRYADFVSREWDVVTQFLTDSLADKGKWINPPASARRAGNKLIQLQAARDYGLSIPETVITNKPEEAASVLPRGKSRGICKPICETGNISADCMAPSSTFTRVEIQRDPDSVSVAPACFQRLVPARLELRTYVFGARAISISIRPRGKARTPDLSCQDLEETDFALTKAFRTHESKLIAMTRGLGLRYAAIDSLVAKDGCYFLEVNPSGGWLWLPPRLSAPLDRAFRDLVMPGAD